MDELMRHFKTRQIGRPHIAEMMVKKEWCHRLVRRLIDFWELGAPRMWKV